MEQKQTDVKKGVWKRDPRGVDYVTFTMPEELADSMTTFVFSSVGGTQYKAQVTSSADILGVIILMRPKNQDV